MIKTQMSNSDKSFFFSPSPRGNFFRYCLFLNRADETLQALVGHQHKFQSTLSSQLTLFSGFLRIFLVAAGWQATFGTTTFIIFECCCCDNCAAEAIDVEFDELFVGGNVSVIHESTDKSSRGPSLCEGEKGHGLFSKIFKIEWSFKKLLLAAIYSDLFLIKSYRLKYLQKAYTKNSLIPRERVNKM